MTVAAAALGAAGVLLSSPGAAQEAKESGTGADTVPPRYRGEPIRVTVTRDERALHRVPFSVSVVEAEEIQTGERILSLQESLQSVPGVTVQDRRNFSLGDRITVRGAGGRAQFGVRGVRVLADGIPLTMPDGQTSLTNLSRASAGRVEVIRGPSSALYGNAAGGVIRFQSEDFARAAFRGEPRVLAGSHGYLETVVEASGGTREPVGTGYVFTGSRMETDGFRRHARAELYRGNLVVRAPLGDDTRLRGVLNAYDRPFAQNPSSLSREDARKNPRKARSFIVQQGAGEEATQVQGGLTLTHGWGRASELKATAWVAARNVWNPIPTRIIALDRTAGGLRSRMSGQVTVAGLPLRWTGGLDAAVQADQRRETVNRGVGEGGGRAREGEALVDQRERVTSVAPFARLMLEPAPAWQLTGTIRYDRYRFDAEDDLLADGDDSGERTLTDWSPAVGVSYAATDAVSIYAHAATAFETPTTSELSNRPSGEGGFNPALQPEELRSLELGTRGRRTDLRLRWQLSGYISEVDNALIPFEGATDEVFYRNAGRVDRRGLEASLSWRPLPPLRAQLSYTIQENTFDEFETPASDFSGKAEPGVPDQRLSASVRYRGPEGIRAEVDFRWVDDFPVNDANTAYNWAYEVTDLRLVWSREVGPLGLQPVLGVDNVFDVRYNGSVVPNAFGGRFFEPAPGREIYGGLRLRVGS